MPNKPEECYNNCIPTSSLILRVGYVCLESMRGHEIISWKILSWVFWEAFEGAIVARWEERLYMLRRKSQKFDTLFFSFLFFVYKWCYSLLCGPREDSRPGAWCLWTKDSPYMLWGPNPGVMGMDDALCNSHDDGATEVNWTCSHVRGETLRIHVQAVTDAADAGNYFNVGEIKQKIKVKLQWA